MDTVPLHSWQVSPEEAIAIQKGLREKILLKRKSKKLERIAAADVTYRESIATAGVVVFSYPELKILEESLAQVEVKFPYIPGLLSFREGPCIIKALEKIKEDIDLLLFDGQGIAHPRRMGIATHLGIYLNIPSVGCAKSKLVGKNAPLANREGANEPLYDGGEMIGYVVRCKKNAKPIFVSPGNLIDFETTLKVVLSLCRGHRVPEPLRLAHIFVNKNKKGG